MRVSWTKREEQLLRDNYNVVPNEELLALFPERTYVSIYKKARSLGFYKDKALESINRSSARKGEKGANWKGGRKRTKKGYIQVLAPEHERADKNGYVMEHIKVFEDETGVKVPDNCVVHHLNGDKTDNRIENLCLMSFGGHTTYHNNIRWGNK